MKQVLVATVVLASCLLCAGCGAADSRAQDSIAEAVTSTAPEDLITVQDASTESQSEVVTMADAIRENEMLSTALVDLTLDYQSGDWYGQPRHILDGKFLARVDSDYIMLQRQTDALERWVSSLTNVHLPVDRNVFDFVDSGIFANDAGEEHYYWLGEDGVYCYELGMEIAIWPIPGVERGKAFLTQYGDYAPCVRTDHQIIYCAPGGETTVLAEDAE